jgi:hypothetical protein
MGVEKGIKAVISANFSVCGEPIFNNLRTNLVAEILRKEFFNTHRPFTLFDPGPPKGGGA